MNVPALDTLAHRVAPRAASWARRPWVWVICGAVVLAVLAAALRFGPMFTVTDVTVKGAEQVTDTDVVVAAAVATGSPLLSVPLDEIATRVEQIDAIADAQVTRDWPNTLTIVVRERRPVGYVTTADGVSLVGSDGDFYSHQTQRPDDLPQLPGVVSTGVGDSYGSQLDASAAAALEVAVSVPTRMQRLLQRIDAETANEVELAFEDGVLVRWGSSGAGESKADVVMALRERPGWGKQFTIVDVTAPEAPALS